MQIFVRPKKTREPRTGCILKELQKPLQLKIFFFQNSNTPDCSYVPKIETKKGQTRKNQFDCPVCIWLVRLLGQNASYVLKVTLKRNPYVNVFKGWLYLRAFKWPLFEHDGLGKSLTYQLRFKATPSKYMAKKTFKKWRIKNLCFLYSVKIFWFLIS